MGHRTLLFIFLLALWAPSVYADNEEDAKQAMIKGTELFEKKRYKDALGFYLQALELVPERTGPYREVAKCYEQLDNAPEALHYFTEYLRRKPDASERAEYEQKIYKLQVKLTGKSTAPLSVISDPPGAAVYLIAPGKEPRGIGFTPLQEVAVPSDTTSIRLLSAKHPPKESAVNLSSGSASVSVSLIESLAPNDTLDDPLPKTAPKPDKEPTPKKTKGGNGLLFASIGAGAGALGAGAIFFVEKNTFEGLDAQDLDALEEVRGRLFIEAGVADALTATSVVLGALWVVKRARGRGESALLLSPAGAQLIGSF